MLRIPHLCAFAAAALISGCDQAGEANNSAGSFAFEPAAPSLNAAATDEPAAQRPPPGYAEKEGDLYLYTGELTDNERARGIATAPVVAFRYRGQNDEGQHVLASISEAGSEFIRYRCSNPCRIIRTDSGERIAFSPASILGVAFADAFAGHLSVSRPSQARATPPSSRTGDVPATRTGPSASTEANEVAGEYENGFEPIGPAL